MRELENEEFAELVKMYQSDMYYLALSILRNQADAQDAVGSSILKAFEHKASLRDESKFKSWIMKIVVNTSNSMLRQRNKEVLTEGNIPIK